MTNGGGKPMTTYNDGLFGLGDDCKLYNKTCYAKKENNSVTQNFLEAFVWSSFSAKVTK